MDLTTLGWTYNAKKQSIHRIFVDDSVTSSPIHPKNPAFVSVGIISIEISKNSSSEQQANISSVLTVDLLELSKQNIRNITCGDLKTKYTQLVDVTIVEYFIPSLTAYYQNGLLSRIKLSWTICMLVSMYSNLSFQCAHI